MDHNKECDLNISNYISEINTTEIRSVSDFLNVLKDEVVDINPKYKKRVFRGLSKKSYINIDYPSIYRNPENDSTFEPFVKYEHEMFYDLVSRFPEQFSSCNNTFEHLVMMQHYGFPTRLLDVTTNPLVALYFACVNGQGYVDNDEDGAVTIYDLFEINIHNYESNTITILSNLAKINQSYTPFYAYYNLLVKIIDSLQNGANPYRGFLLSNIFIACIKPLITQFDLLYKTEKEDILRKFLTYERERDKIKIDQLKTELCLLIENEKRDYKLIYNKLLEIKDFFQYIKELHFNRSGSLDQELTLYDHILEDKKYSISKLVYPEDIIGVFYVRPKLNNPRIINQNGAFLLFGFAGQDKTKLDPPRCHYRLKATKKYTNHPIDIIIPKQYKQVIHDELKQLGIHQAFLFPEIDKVAQVITKEYKIKKCQ